MKSTEFCYWLQGFFEITGAIPQNGLSKNQTEMIQRHLHLVFKHEIDPSYPNAAELNQIHTPPPPAKPIPPLLRPDEDDRPSDYSNVIIRC